MKQEAKGSPSMEARGFLLIEPGLHMKWLFDDKEILVSVSSPGELSPFSSILWLVRGKG